MAVYNKNDNWSPKRQRLTPCICPRCKSKHVKAIFWTGSLPARKFCQSCEQIASRDYTPETCTVGYQDKDPSN